MTISFSYAYLKGLDRRIVSSPCVQIAVHRPSRAMSPRMTAHGCDLMLVFGGLRDNRTVHEHRLGDVVRIVARNDMIHAKRGRATVERLPAEDTTERAVVFLSDGRDDAVHRPSVEFVIGKDLERHVVLLLIPFDGLWSIAGEVEL